MLNDRVIVWLLLNVQLLLCEQLGNVWMCLCVQDNSSAPVNATGDGDKVTDFKSINYCAGIAKRRIQAFQAEVGTNNVSILFASWKRWWKMEESN
jgi:hypothetical protein